MEFFKLIGRIAATPVKIAKNIVEGAIEAVNEDED